MYARARLLFMGASLPLLLSHAFAAARLVNTEKMRIVSGVDGELSLARARLLEAQTRMRSANLEGKLLELRESMADLTGLPEEQVEPIPESIPPFAGEAGAERNRASHPAAL